MTPVQPDTPVNERMGRMGICL